MYLETISINNFRVFEDFVLRLNPGLNILVGENDSGKTALIDAIRYTLGNNSRDRYFIEDIDFRNDASSFTIQLKFVSVEQYAHIFVEHLSYEEYKDAGGNKKRKPVLYVQFNANKTGQEKRGYPYIRTDLKSGIDGNGLTLEAEIRDFLSTTYLKPLRDAEAELSSGRGSRLSQILHSSKDLLTPDAIDEILGHVGEANSRLLEVGKPINLTSIKIKDRYLHNLVFEEDKAILHAIIDIAGIKKERLPNLTISQKRRYLRTVLESLSLRLTEDRKKHGLGYHNLLFMAAELLLLEQETENDFPLLLIEEPEAHLHPQLQMKLLQFINSKSKTVGDSIGIQCVLTTHSPNISSKAKPSSIIIMSKGKAFSLCSGETLLGDDDYLHLQKFLDVTKANVFFAKGIIFVEGDSESILIPTIARLIGKPLEDYGVSVVKYDNSGSWKRFAKIFLRSGEGIDRAIWIPVRVSVMRDLDLWPDCAEERGGNRYGFLQKKLPKDGKGGNLEYWEQGPADLDVQINRKKEKLKKDGDVILESQNVKVFISDRWTFEFCLARYGLFKECGIVVGLELKEIEEFDGTDDEKATFVQREVEKTDFAYSLAEGLEYLLERQVMDAIDFLSDEDKKLPQRIEEAMLGAKRAFANGLIEKLPPYIVAAINHATGTA